jgi:hypothetical protein
MMCAPLLSFSAEVSDALNFKETKPVMTTATMGIATLM